MYFMWRVKKLWSTLRGDVTRNDAPPPDPARLVALLWSTGPAELSRGRPSRIDLAGIIEAATGLADTGGLGALTMRALAQALRSSTMALYNHVPSRSSLLVLMLDRACGVMIRRKPDADSWRARAEVVARDHRNLILRHPWITELPATRPPPGPGQAAKYNHDLSALDGLGLDALEVDRTLAALLDLASASARQAVAARHERENTGLSDEAWWAAVAPYFGQAFDPARFPLAARIGTAAATASGGAYDPEATFELGLALMLDGLDKRLQRHGSGVQKS